MRGFRVRKKLQREGPIQKSVVDWARETYKGKIVARKFQAGRFGTNGYPDYEFLIWRDSFHIEFKAPGAECTDLQLQRHAELRALGHRVYVVESVLNGKEIIRAEMEGRRRFKGRKAA